LELDNNTEVAGELGPLQYLSRLTGYPMDKIINVLLLIIIFVFDPLAISLVIAANFAFDKAYPKKKYRDNLYGEKIEDIQVKDAEEIKTNKEFMDNLDKIEKIKKDQGDFDWEAAERRMNIIGQNGNEGEHYSEFDLNKDGKVDAEERLSMIKQLKDLQNEFSGEIKDKLINLEKEIHNLSIKKQ
jgi:hypothetical protein